MLTTNIFLDDRVPKKDGTFPVKLRFNFKREKIYINLKLAASAKNFNNGIFGGEERHLNGIIAPKKTQIDGLLQALELSGELYKFTPKALKKYLENGGKEDLVLIEVVEKKKHNQDQLLFKNRLNLLLYWAKILLLTSR